MRDSWSEISLGDVTTHFRGTVKVENDISYAAAGVMMEGRGLIDREPFIGGVTGYKKLTPIAPGQLVLRSITAWEAPITVVPEGFLGRHVSGVFPVLNLDKYRLEPAFMRLICQWPTFWNEMRMRATGSVLRRKTLSATQLQEIPMNLPPLSEQKRIVDVLSSVDVYIDALQQQAHTARTSRNAVLHELLSAGGDDWTETTLGEISTFVSARKLPNNLKSDVPYIGLEHVDPKTSTISRWGQIESVSSSVTPFEPEDVLFGRLRPYLHKVAIADFPGVCSPEVLVLRALSMCEPRLLHLLCSTDATVNACVEMSAGTRMPRTSTNDLASIEVLLPPLEEQKRIVEIVSSMDDVIRATEQAVTEAKNLRSGLLSDLLSGEHEIPASYDVFVGAA